LRENHRGFIEKLIMSRADITYCKTLNDFDRIAKEVSPSIVYYTGRINRRIGEEMIIVKSPEQIRQYILSKGIEQAIPIAI
jgi:hypothetical protein